MINNKWVILLTVLVTGIAYSQKSKNFKYKPELLSKEKVTMSLKLDDSWLLDQDENSHDGIYSISNKTNGLSLYFYSNKFNFKSSLTFEEEVEHVYANYLSEYGAGDEVKLSNSILNEAGKVIKVIISSKQMYYICYNIIYNDIIIAVYVSKGKLGNEIITKENEALLDVAFNNISFEK